MALWYQEEGRSSKGGKLGRRSSHRGKGNEKELHAGSQIRKEGRKEGWMSG